MSIAHHHTEWLSLLETSGPFLSLEVLLHAFPQGLDDDEPDLRRRLRLAYDEWRDSQQGLHQPDAALHGAWVRYVLTDLLEFPADYIAAGPAIPDRLQVAVPEHGETLRPDLVIAEPGEEGARLLVQVFPLAQRLDRDLAGRHWKATPTTRMMELLHATGVRLGLLTNGEQWLLVNAPRGETTGLISWYAELWLEEPLTLRAWRSLLGVRRFFGVPADETIEGLLARSADAQYEVADQLGYQVRRAVEVLVQAIDLANQDAHGRLLADVSEARLYEAAITVMMRLVFLFAAEERELLPLDDELYQRHYAASPLRSQLREAADAFGEEVIERRTDAWHRLLATFRAVHGGIVHERLRLPAYGGSLFDPDRFPFLEGRRDNTGWTTTPARPLPINNRTVLHLLEALQLLAVKSPGGERQTRRLSFRALDIEQIGQVYEGLLDHQAVRAGETVLGLVGNRDAEPEVPLAELEALSARGEETLVAYLKEATRRTPNTLRKALATEPDLRQRNRLLAACANDSALCQRLLAYAGLIRQDDLGQPVVILPGSVYVTAGQARRASGAHYTPRSLTEPIVQHTLEPLVYRGPAEGWPRERWQLRTPAELLRLKVCDMAMGSGAFLVQVDRYLAERLVEAWEVAERQLARGKAAGVLIDIEGQPATDPDQAIPPASEDRLILARRLVAERCLYGVDKNPLAVEIAKLSLWLVTLDRGRPFSFLDHALKCGDSLVGVDLDQLRCWDLSGGGQRQFGALGIDRDIERMISHRRQISQFPVRSVEDQTDKAYLLAQAEAIAHDLKRAGDLLIASYYNDLPKAQQATLRSALLAAARDMADVEPQWRQQADLGDLRPFHWPLEFPEVFLAEGRAGFDAFVGNPPFVGGKRIREALGDHYRTILYDIYPGSQGGADLSAFFFLRAFSNLSSNGTLGLIATNTIAQGDTRLTGLATLEQEAATIFRAINNMPWPGQAAVVVNVVHIAKGKVEPPYILDESPVDFISSQLDSRKVIGEPHTLVQNANKSFIGSFVNGMGFVLTPDEAQELLNRNQKNRDVVFPYLNGEDLNSNPDQSPSRWVINFFDWPLQRGARGSWSAADERQRKEWQRSGTVPDDYPGPVAADYPDCLEIIRERVYPVRTKVNREAHRKYWWHYGDKRPLLYATIAPLQRVLVLAIVSRTVAFAFVPNHQVYAHKLAVFAHDEVSYFSVLQSSLHYHWAWQYSSTLKQDLNYSPTDVFETFPFPQSPISQSLDLGGETYHEHRRQLMLDRWEGLTATYNRFHHPGESAADIAHLRQLHVKMDHAVAAAYGWADLDLGHGFHATPQGIRYTLHDTARRQVLTRLLALNHERHAEEVQAGLHEKKGKKGGKGNRERGKQGKKGQMGLFGK